MPDVSICLRLVRSLISDSFVAHWLGSFVCRDLKVKVAQLADVSTVLLLHVCLFVFFGFCSQ